MYVWHEEKKTTESTKLLRSKSIDRFFKAGPTDQNSNLAKIWVPVWGCSGTYVTCDRPHTLTDLSTAVRCNAMRCDMTTCPEKPRRDVRFLRSATNKHTSLAQYDKGNAGIIQIPTIEQ